MSKLTDLLRQVERTDPQLAADLEREYMALSSRRAFGLNFERHHPESTEWCPIKWCSSRWPGSSFTT